MLKKKLITSLILVFLLSIGFCDFYDGRYGDVEDGLPGSTTSLDIMGTCNPKNIPSCGPDMHADCITSPTCSSYWMALIGWQWPDISIPAIAKCRTGYVNHFNDIGHPGCELYCHECIGASDCPNPSENGQSVTCEQGHCNYCKYTDLACKPGVKDGHCDRDLTDADGYYCYYNTDLDCYEEAVNEAGVTNDTLCNGNGITGLKAHGFERRCIDPLCDANADCDSGKICQNPGEWNAFCARVLGEGKRFLAETIKELDNIPEDGKDYLFVIYEKEDVRMDIYYTSTEDYTGELSDFTLVQGGLKTGDYFNVEGKEYRTFFSIGEVSSDFSLDIYEVSFYTRLTYNVFPVCGNGICETCEEENNCIHYPPESCMSCPLDCPSVDDAELNEFNAYYLRDVNYNDLLADNDLACQVNNKDVNSLCNPLCITHKFIDESGCIYNRYSPAQPVYENGTLALDDFYTRSINTIEFKEEEVVVFEGEDDEFYGEAPFNSYYEDEDYNPVFDKISDEFLSSKGGNSECLSNCECVTNYCSEENPNIIDNIEYGHCCPTGFEWSDEDSIADIYCDGEGKVVPEFREVFADTNGDGFVDITQSISIAENVQEMLERDGRKVTDYLCVDGSDDNYKSCNYGMDPLCVYETLDKKFYPIKPDGIFQCRAKSTKAASVIPDIQCTIHTHAWAHAGCDSEDWTGECKDAWWGQNEDPYYDWMCVTDNPDECFSGELVREYSGYSGVVLGSIDYETFCTTKNLVCENTMPVNNYNLKGGGYLHFSNCPQDGFASEGSNFWNALGQSSNVGYTPMSVGYYCSLFGNDLVEIMGVHVGSQYLLRLNSDPLKGTENLDLNKYTVEYWPGWWALPYNGEYYMRHHHMPRIDRDANEELYHYLFNYETCKMMFGDEVPDCTGIGNNLGVKDEKGQPTHPYVGVYEQPTPTTFVKSRDYCDEFWKVYEEKYGTYKWVNTALTDKIGELGYPNDLFADIIPETVPVEYEGQVYEISVYSEESISNLLKITFEDVPLNAEITVFEGTDKEETLNYITLTNIIKNSCLYWYEPFLNTYYDPSVPGWDVGVKIEPPFRGWVYNQTDELFGLSESNLKPIDINWVRNQGYCNAYYGFGTGEIMPGQRCSYEYPFIDFNGECGTSLIDPSDFEG